MSIKIALAGNPNCGKTTLFNALTGSNQFVGNWPGVTVEKKEGKLKGHKDVTIMDLPGIYSLSPYTLEEVVARNYLINEMPDAIINIVDGTNIERNLYLSTQIMELGIPVVMAINMMDLVQKSGNKIHIDKLSKKLGCEVVEISALKGTGIMKAAEKAISAAQSKKKTIPVHEFAQDVEDAIKSVENKLTGTVAEAQKRFFAIKLIEKDDKIVEQMKSVPDVSYEVKALEDKFDDDTESIITNERYVYISSIIGQCYTKSSTGKKLTTSDKIDRIVTNRWLALPIFAVVMWVVYYVSVTTVGTIVTDWTNDVLFGEIIPPAVESALEAVNCAAWLQGLILDGIVAGVGAVLGFVPQMLVLFLFLAFLESCGYMARVAFIMDRIFRKFGLSGKSFIPMLIGSGCGVPGVMASRTIENDRDRKMTIMTTTFVPCGAKLPIIAMIAGAFFNNSGWVATSSYFVGIAAIICSGIILKKTKMFAGEPAPFVMELPAYHWPTVGNILRSMWERGWSFIKKAGTIILAISIVIWAAMTFPSLPDSQKAPFEEKVAALEGQQKGLQEDSEQYKALQDQIDEANNDLAAAQLRYSYGGRIGVAIEPVTKYLGFTWRTNIALVAGVAAKEAVVSTLGTAYSMGEQDPEDAAPLGERLKQDPDFTPAVALSLMIFILFYSPCFVSLVVIKSEAGGWRWLFFSMIVDTIFAAILAFIAYNIGRFVWGC